MTLHGTAPDFADVARQLFPVAHLFESVGFMTVSREIAHIERALRELAPEAAAAPEEEADPDPPKPRSSTRPSR